MTIASQLHRNPDSPSSARRFDWRRSAVVGPGTMALVEGEVPRLVVGSCGERCPMGGRRETSVQKGMIRTVASADEVGAVVSPKREGSMAEDEIAWRCGTCFEGFTNLQAMNEHTRREHPDIATPERVRATRAQQSPTTRQSSGRSRDGQMVCPHCHVRGSVRTRRVRLKKGVSGGKATGAIFTAGLSLFATGLSRKEKATEARCTNCGATWHYS